MPFSPRTCLLLALSTVCANPVFADIVKLPGGEPEVVAATEEPRRGMTKAQVLDRYGEPRLQRAPVGQPPISRWDYVSYTVYFEGEHVLHSVVHGQ